MWQQVNEVVGRCSTTITAATLPSRSRNWSGNNPPRQQEHYAVMKTLVAMSLLVFTTYLPAQAAEDESDRAARWKDLQHAVFGDRVVEDGGGLVTLDAPARAMDAALVPVTITIDPAAHIKTLYLTVDSNPSPLAGTFHFGPAADPHEIRTRVRVEQYTLMHAIVETDDGRLLSTERFVKAAGGCSAPMGGDAKAALSRMGQMRFRVEAAPAHSGVETA